MIQLSGVTKYYDGATALLDIHLDVEQGEFAFITGPSGAGKTTLLKVIFCAEQADEGTLVVNGRDLGSMRPHETPYLRRTIGFVFQDYKLLPHLSVVENITLALKAVGVPFGDINRRARQMLKKVGMYDRRHLLPPVLSGGEQQKVAIARALVNEPQLLLADEPTGNLDPQSAREVFALFKDANAKGTTVIVATHDWERVRRMRRRIITMERGRVTDDGRHAFTMQGQLPFLDDDWEWPTTQDGVRG